MLAHSFDKSYVVTKFILPTINDLKFSTINVDEKSDYLPEKMDVMKMLKNIFLILGFIAKRLYLLFIIIEKKSQLSITQHIIF